MSEIKQIAVFCGASPTVDPKYADVIDQLAAALATANITLVYGGGNVGLYGKLADAMLRHKGKVIGVMPKFLADKEIAHDKLTELHIVKTMHERKALISEYADGFIMLPGGLGTLEEFFEVLSLTQLGLHNKPCGILNTNQYYDILLKFLDHAVSQNFVSPAHYEMILVDNNPEKLLNAMINYQGLKEVRWMETALMEK